MRPNDDEPSRWPKRRRKRSKEEIQRSRNLAEVIRTFQCGRATEIEPAFEFVIGPEGFLHRSPRSLGQCRSC